MARTSDPNANIVRFFMQKPLDIAKQALSTAKTIVAARESTVAAKGAAPVPRKRRRRTATVQTGTAPGTTETATATPVAATPVDITQPAAPAAPATPRRRRPPAAPITAPGATVTPQNPTGAMPALGTGTTTGS